MGLDVRPHNMELLTEARLSNTGVLALNAACDRLMPQANAAGGAPLGRQVRSSSSSYARVGGRGGASGVAREARFQHVWRVP